MQQSDYSFTDKILHKIALGPSFIGELTFDLENMLAKKAALRTDDRPVFISGLARAGTTVLMRSFYETNQFTSLTYRDMPFVLMPRLWRRFSRSSHKKSSLKERAHEDGVLVGFDSPEAFEEVFWRVFTGKDYIFNDSLRPYIVSNEIILKFQQYVSHIVGDYDSSTGLRYLSKNNNNIIRLQAIKKACPNALILLAFRDPIQHAISLYYQHKKFCTKHNEDKFSYDYMCWLGHHEFGGTHKPFIYNEGTQSRLKQYSTDNVNYWLVVWIEAYMYLLSTAPADSHFICYESLCEKPVDVLSSLFEKAEIPFEDGNIQHDHRAPLLHKVNGIDDHLLRESKVIYTDLLNRVA